jgi:hypothetical protein
VEARNERAENMLRNAYKFKIAPHKQKCIVKKIVCRKMGPPGPVLKHT